MSSTKWLKTADGRIIAATPHLVENARKFKLHPSDPPDESARPATQDPELDLLTGEYEAKFGRKPPLELGVDDLRYELNHKEDDQERNELALQYEKKFGVKPHFRAGIKKLREDLAKDSL